MGKGVAPNALDSPQTVPATPASANVNDAQPVIRIHFASIALSSIQVSATRVPSLGNQAQRAKFLISSEFGR